MSRNEITVLVSSSPIESHPSTDIIAETIASVRVQLPGSRIVIMLDGVRPEQEKYQQRYLTYIERLVGLSIAANPANVALMPFMDFTHQANMTIKALEMVDTPYILFVEHDTPLMRRTIDWEYLKFALHSEMTNHIRLHYDEQIHPEHQHLMKGHVAPRLIRSIQWHQRPHLANRDWYEEKLRSVFSPKSLTFIEDRMYTFCENAPWEDFKLTVYDPDGTGQNMKRSRDLNGRGSDPKYSMVF